MSEFAHQSHHGSTLYTEPSFSIYADDEFGEEAQSAQMMGEMVETIGENIAAEFSFDENETRTIEEDEEKSSSRFKDLKIEIGGEQISPPIDQAKGGGGEAAAAVDKWRNHAQYLEVDFLRFQLVILLLHLLSIIPTGKSKEAPVCFVCLKSYNN